MLKPVWQFSQFCPLCRWLLAENMQDCLTAVRHALAANVGCLSVTAWSGNREGHEAAV